MRKLLVVPIVAIGLFVAGCDCRSNLEKATDSCKEQGGLKSFNDEDSDNYTFECVGTPAPVPTTPEQEEYDGAAS